MPNVNTALFKGVLNGTGMGFNLPRLCLITLKLNDGTGDIDCIYRLQSMFLWVMDELQTIQEQNFSARAQVYL